MRYVLILLFLCSVAHAQEKTTVFQLGDDSRLEILYHMNESAWDGTADEIKDASGNGRHAFAKQRSAGGSPDTTADGMFVRCGESDGFEDATSGNNRVHCAAGNFVPFNSYWSISFWINLNSQTNGDFGYNFVTTNYAALEQSSSKWHLFIYDGTIRGILSADTINTGQWYFIVTTYGTDDNKGNLYIDGVYEGTTAAIVNEGYNYGHNNGIFGHGKYDGTVAKIMDGRIDEFAVWNVRLELPEIRKFYTEGQKVHIN